MGYSEALEQQVALLRWAESAAGRRWITTLSRTPEGWEQWSKASVQALRYGATFYWDESLTEVLQTAARGLPAWRLYPDALPVPDGFFWFAKPLVLPPLIDVNGEPLGDSIHAISWATMRFARRAADGVALVFFTQPMPVHTAVLPTCSWAWVFGEAHTDAAKRDPDPAAPESSRLRMAYTAAALAFINQRILVAPHVQAERHARKRLARAGWTHEAVVRVVQLRRRQRTALEPVHPTDRHYSCQWIVRGHWRQQWYPKAQRNQPKWILPYVKGPEDTPLKTPRATVFAVVR